MVPFQDEFVHFFLGGGVKKELSPLHILCFLDSWSKEKHTKRWFLFTKPIRFYTIDLYLPTYTHDIQP